VILKGVKMKQKDFEHAKSISVQTIDGTKLEYSIANFHDELSIMEAIEKVLLRHQGVTKL
jgi:hypothetical protein